MALRKGHGTGAGSPRIEVLPVDELPVGVPDDSRSMTPEGRDAKGRFQAGNGMAAVGGRSRAGKVKLAARLGLASLGDGNAFRAYKASAASFRRAQCAELAKTVGGGVCGPAPSSFVASAALQLAWSRYLGDMAAEQNDADLALRASRLAEASRQNLLAAHELCAKEALSRPRANPLAELHRAVLPPKGGKK